VTRNVSTSDNCAVKPGGSYSPRRHWCTSKPVHWEPGSEVCVQIIGDVRSIAAIPFASLLSFSLLGPPGLMLSAMSVSTAISSLRVGSVIGNSTELAPKTHSSGNAVSRQLS